MKPQGLQKLRHDKVLVKQNFPLFVETFNYMLDRLENLKGDGDADPQNGHIKLDNTDPEHPVIRLINADGLGGGSGGAYTPDIEPWTVDFSENTIYHPYFQIGTYRGTAKQNVDISSMINTTQTHRIYCNMDLVKLSASIDTYEVNDITHQGVQVMQLSCISVDTGEVDEDENPIYEYKQQFSYTCRYPIAPVWESFTF